MPGIWKQHAVMLRLHTDVLAAMCFVSIFVIAILEYGYIIHSCDLICWRQQFELVKNKPLIIMIFIAGFKLMLILMLTLLSYLKVSPVAEPSISHLKHRFCRFIVMRLLAAYDEFLHGEKEFHRRHSTLVKAIHLFRYDARKLCERNSTELTLPIEQMLPVEELEEAELFDRGYKSVPQLIETDIYRLGLAITLATGRYTVKEREGDT